MKQALFKTPIPPDQTLVVKDLIEPYFDPFWHFHTEYQLFVVLKGSGTRFVGDNISPFESGDMVLTGPNLPHLWRCEEHFFIEQDPNGTRGIVVYFQKDMLGEEFWKRKEGFAISQLLKQSERGLEISSRDSDKLLPLFIQMAEESGFGKVLLLLEILHQLSEHTKIYPLASLGYKPMFRHSDTERLNRVQSYIFKNYKSGLSLKEAASIANMSPSAFSRYFKQRTHKKFSQFVSEVRIGHACKLLLEDQMNVSEVAFACGFPTLSNFNKQFRMIMDKSPSEYKQTYEETMPLSH